eukprot:TRINITY_DN1917_c0_g2_i1.p1 TRINITY_DN1917_c0_g2~~TRINITY_DN1917_c0_g2_i1.p1  ORF type:complete len:279 (+),score=23.32 TRINITY_DN1917_c0_g2_i1:49-837(+)
MSSRATLAVCCLATMAHVVCALGTVPGRPVIRREGEACVEGGFLTGYCASGLVCKPPHGDYGVGYLMCQYPVAAVAGGSCADVICAKGTTCVNDTATGYYCTPVDRRTTCKSLACPAAMYCAEDDTVGAKCVPFVDKPLDKSAVCATAEGVKIAEGKSARIGCNTCTCVKGKLRCGQQLCSEGLKLGEVCTWNGKPSGSCTNNLVCRPLEGIPLVIEEHFCQFPGLTSAPLTCAAVTCERGTACIADARGAVCVPRASGSKY